MLTLSLDGKWSFRRTTDSEWLEGQVPGSVCTDLLRAGKIEDPFYRDNEDLAKEIASHDYEYLREFAVTDEMLECDKVFLRCEGIDTLAEIEINGQTIANVNNMHRTYEFEVKPYLLSGRNTIRVTLFSPLAYIARKQQERPLWGAGEAVPGFPHIRKAHYMFGWDWGPQIPDAGIWRSISLVGYRGGRLEDLFITQHHRRTGGRTEVTLDIRIRCRLWAEGPAGVEVLITAPDGSTFAQKTAVTGNEQHVQVEIPDPKIWWPNGYGDQPLYRVQVCLVKDDRVLDRDTKTIGLRTIRVRREPDQWGESFEFEVNGIPIFAKGANYIPQDNLLGRRTPEKTEQLIRDCVAAHFNILRVWGGGIYEDDHFYNLCDKYGLIVWQDLMFACAVYELTDEFADNIKREVADNVKRLRHHACLGLWCGNNEMEWGWAEWNRFEKDPKLRTDYLKQFEIILKEVVQENDPVTLYWPSSPSSGGGFDNPNDENRGDVHYWEVWHGLKPFADYRKHHFRFCSEFGFQSFPSRKTVEAFTKPEDRNIFSYVMEKHQKNGAANGKILFYLAENFKYPKDFDSLLYTSQILQAEAVRCGVEHWRRHRGRCMGSIYWQLNDCWPVASWSSIDYYGRWKALHYFARKFYAPVLVSACEEGTRVELHVTNDRLSPVSGTVVWRLRDHASRIVKEGSLPVTVAALSAQQVAVLDFAEELRTLEKKRTHYLEFRLRVADEWIGEGTVLFVKAKHFEFLNPHIECTVLEEEDHFRVDLRSRAFARYVELELQQADGRWSDNYFDLSAGNVKTVKLEKSTLSRPLTLEEFRHQLHIRSLYDIDEAVGGL